MEIDLFVEEPQYKNALELLIQIVPKFTIQPDRRFKLEPTYHLFKELDKHNIEYLPSRYEVEIIHAMAGKIMENDYSKK